MSGPVSLMRRESKFAEARRSALRGCLLVLKFLGDGMYWVGVAFGGYVVPQHYCCDAHDSGPADDKLTELELWWQLEARDPR